MGAGTSLRRLRTQKGLTLEEVAARLGWDKARVSKYETNRLAISPRTMLALARALEVPPEVLVLTCVQECYPKLKRSPVGSLLARAVRLLQP